jgi:two-component system, chemotaxis family, protein-glutamate methylesterase/glutaminase
MAQDQINHTELLVIGGSSGSLEVVLAILKALPVSFHIPIILVIHRASSSESLLDEVLSLKSNLPVVEVEEKEMIRPFMVYLAPADFHLLIEKDKTFSLDYSEKISYSRPSINVTFLSAAARYGSALMGILLSGANDDGTDGMKAIRDNGGYCIIQDPADAIVDFMPRYALNHMDADAVLSGPEIIQFLLSLSTH